MFGHFVGLVLKGLRACRTAMMKVPAEIVDKSRHRCLKWSEISLRKSICDILHGIVLFVQLKRREKHPWRSVTLSKVAGFSLQLY